MLLPIIIAAVTGIIIYAVFSGVIGQVQSVTSSFTSDLKAPEVVNTVRVPTRAPTTTPTPAPSPTPSYATQVLSFGGKGIGQGKFTDARYVGVDGKGNIYAAEYSGAREDMVRFDAKGKVVLVISGPISMQTEDLSLDNLPLVDGINDIYIVSSTESAIFRFTSDGKYVNRFGSGGSDPGQIYSPQGFAVDGQDNLYISDSDGISIFQTDGRFVRRFKEGGSSFTIAFDNRDNLYTVDGATVTEYTLGQ